MKWVPDRTGRFPRRPHYDPQEIDRECEQIIGEFLAKRYGRVEFPISTSDLTVLVEEATEDLDLGADLSEDGTDVEGITEFKPGSKPSVKISRTLLEAPNKENRLRTTLTHEYGHVHFHRFMFEVEEEYLPTMRDEPVSNPARLSRKCKREAIVGASETDWMEWQAGYACGALLMPLAALTESVREFREVRHLPFTPLVVTSSEGQELIQVVARFFQTSRDAARVRLVQRRFLEEHIGGDTGHLFSL